MRSAREIYQDVLNGMSIAFLTQDYGLARSLMNLPHCVRTASHEVEHRTEDELWQMFRDFCQTLTERRSARPT